MVLKYAIICYRMPKFCCLIVAHLTDKVTKQQKSNKRATTRNKLLTMKEPIKLRYRTLKNGSKSLYLDIYVNGQRDYEYLKLYLIPEKTKRDKEQNRQTMMVAEAVRAQRIIEVQNGRYGFTKTNNNINFLDYLLSVAESKVKPDSKATYKGWMSMYRMLSRYCKAGMTFASVTEDWCERFRQYLLDEPIAQNTKNVYWTKFCSLMKEAVNDGILQTNPAARLERIKRVDTERAYLTLEEVKAMANAPCQTDVLKRAFLFSCLTGLRKSDVERLTWGDVTTNGEFTRIIFRQKKTKGVEYIDINRQAVQFMGERGNDEDLVFDGFHYTETYNIHLQRWAIMAGVSKPITYHSSRHTFALLMLDLGVDIYTLSKLLGHRKVTTTQVYAHILDRKKQEAVTRIPDLGL